MKRNLFVRKGECWDCHEKFHLIVITKYNGLLCKKCYQEKYKTMKHLFFDFIGSFEVEYDTDFKKETKISNFLDLQNTWILTTILA